MHYTLRGILQARILEWVAFPSPGDLSNPGIKLRSPSLLADSLPAERQGKLRNTGVGSLSLLYQICPTQESNWGLLHCRQIPYHLSYQGSLHIYVENILDNHIIYLYLSIYETFGAFTVWYCVDTWITKGKMVEYIFCSDILCVLDIEIFKKRK